MQGGKKVNVTSEERAALHQSCLSLPIAHFTAGHRAQLHSYHFRSGRENYQAQECSKKKAGRDILTKLRNVVNN